ncbi:MAG: thioredoxin-disulfide reductase [Treponema sp.]|jgi:thioredoxin reductase (NADPH)|nr:thioredoxin-disulfide reductase [Treponema sp.]
MFDFDLIIIGAGPAGLTAAQYGARASLKVLVIEQMTPGGQALVIDVLENYPGNAGLFDSSGKMLSAPKSGYEVAMDMHRQAELFGAIFLTETVNSLKKEGDAFLLALDNGEIKKAKAVIIASGSKPRMLDVPGEEEFAGRGVSYCATCDGNFFKGKKIFVVGGGDAACDEARYLSKLSDKITLVHRRDSFRAQKALAERTMKNPNIKVRFNTVIKEIKGEKKVNLVVLADTQTGEIFQEETDAVFIFTGTVPQTPFLSGGNFKCNLGIDTDESGYIKTCHKMATNIPGLYAAGDVRSGAFRQVITAAADGAAAAHNAANYIDGLNNG